MAVTRVRFPSPAPNSGIKSIVLNLVPLKCQTLLFKRHVQQTRANNPNGDLQNHQANCPVAGENQDADCKKHIDEN
jgi:hypothetical protein